MMQKKSETGKTILAVALLAVMLGVFYFTFFKPKAAPGGTTAVAGSAATTSAATAPEAAKETNAAESPETPAEAGGSGKQAADNAIAMKPKRGPFKPPMHRELAPSAYFSLEEYRDMDAAGLSRHYASVLNANKFAETKIARDSDKSFAGTAYFSSIEAAPPIAELKNPFTPIIKKDDKLNRFTTGIDTTKLTPGGSSGSTGSTDIWDWFTTPGLPTGSEFVPPSNGLTNGSSGSDGTSQPYFDPNVPVISGGPAKVLGVALSGDGASALIEIGPADNREVIRVRVDQILEGRFKVAKIAEDVVVIADLNSGKTFELKLTGTSRRFA